MRASNFPFVLQLGWFYSFTTSALLSSSPTRGKVPSARWCYGEYTSIPCPSLSLGTYLVLTITLNRIKAGYISRRGTKRPSSGIPQPRQGVEEHILFCLGGWLGASWRFILGRWCSKGPDVMGYPKSFSIFIIISALLKRSKSKHSILYTFQINIATTCLGCMVTSKKFLMRFSVP